MKQNYTIKSASPRSSQRAGALDGVEAFLSVAGQKSFRKAAATLGVTPSAVSQAIRALEARLGAALFIRTTRSVGLTEAGAHFLTRAKPAFEELVAAGAAARDLGTRPTGLLRISVPRAVVPTLLEPLIAGFCAAYPAIELEIAASEELVDLAAAGFDAGIRMGGFIAPEMVAVRMTPPFPFIIVGSPAYLARHGTPKTADDLAAHACLRRRRPDGTIAPWLLTERSRDEDAGPSRKRGAGRKNPLPGATAVGDKKGTGEKTGGDEKTGAGAKRGTGDGARVAEISVSGPFIAHDFPTLLGAALEGMGLTQVPAPMAAAALKAGRLVEVMPDLGPMTPGVFLYYPDRHRMLPKLRAFIGHVKQQGAQRPGQSRAPSRDQAPGKSLKKRPT